MIGAFQMFSLETELPNTKMTIMLCVLYLRVVTTVLSTEQYKV